MNFPELINPDFRAIPLSSITVPVTMDALPPDPIEHPALPRSGGREYLRHMRKLFEQNLSRAKVGNRAQRRAYARKLRFA